MKVRTPVGIATVLEEHHEVDPYSHEQIDEYWVTLEDKRIKMAVKISDCGVIDE
jgi:hypothetical protein